MAHSIKNIFGKHLNIMQPKMSKDGTANKKWIFVHFLDDQVITAQGDEDISYIDRKVKEEYEKIGLEINFKKTMFMTITEGYIKWKQ